MTNAEKFKEVFGFEHDNPCPHKECKDPDGDDFETCEDCLNDFWECEYQGEPTIPLSVIEKIKTYIHKEVMFRDLWHGEKDLMDYIDKAVKERTHDKG